jgi:NosR/NirI family transcriptional regulator, nitrous oxide reductase regulator
MKAIYLKGISMKRIRLFLAILLAFVTIGISTYPAFACNITIAPGSVSGSVGDILTFTLNVQKTHRNCTTPIEQTQIKLTGLELVSETPWQKTSSDNYTKQISAKIKENIGPKVEVIRECSKGGGYAAVSVTIKAATVTSPVTAPAPTYVSIPSDISPVLSEPPQSQSNQDNPGEISWGQALAQSIAEPYILALLILIVLSTIALVKRFYRFRYLILLISLAYLGFVVGGCPCTLGSLQTIIIKTGEIKNHLPAYLQVGILVISAVLLGRIFCGWVCPMGAVQSFIYRKELRKKTRIINAGIKLYNWPRYTKYFVLAGLVASVLVTRTPAFASIDPFKALFNFDFSLLIPTIILVILLLISLFWGFPWCKYICPLGAFLSIFARFSFFRIRIADNCTNCGACHKVFCEYGAIKPGEAKPEINQTDCVRCGECISHCPKAAIDLNV